MGSQPEKAAKLIQSPAWSTGDGVAMLALFGAHGGMLPAGELCVIVDPA